MHRNDEEEDDDDILMIRYSGGGGVLPTAENGPSGATSEPSQGEDGSSGGSSGGGGDHHLVSQHHHAPATPLADSDETRPSLVVSVRTLRANAASQRRRHHHLHYRNITLNSRNTTQITTTTITTTTTTTTAPTTQSTSAAELNPSVFLERLLGSPAQNLLGSNAGGGGGGGGGSGTSGGSGGGTSGAGVLTVSGVGGNNGDHVHVTHHRGGVSATIGGPSTSAASVVASLNQGNGGQNNGGGSGSTLSNGAATLFRDATRVVVVDNGFNSIFSNSEDSGSIDLVDQAGYLFGRSLAATLNSTPPPLHWWLEEAKVLGLESQSDVCLTVCNSLIPKLEEQRSAEVAKSRGKRSKKGKDGESTKSQSQQTDPTAEQSTAASTVEAAAGGTDETANMAEEASEEANATAAVVAAEAAEANEDDDDEDQEDDDDDEDEEEDDDDNNSDDDIVADAMATTDRLVASLRANATMVGSDRIAAAIDDALADADSDDHSHALEDDEDDDDEENPSEPGEMAGPEFLMQLDDAESSASDSGSLPESILSLSTVPSPRDAAGGDEEDSDHHMVDLSGTAQRPIVVTLPLTATSNADRIQTNRSPGSGSLTMSSSPVHRNAAAEEAEDDEDEEAMSSISDLIMEESSAIDSSDEDTSVQPTGMQNSQSSDSCIVVDTNASQREPMVIDDEAANAPLPEDDDDEEPIPGTLSYLVGGLLNRIQADKHKMRYAAEVVNTPVPPTIIIDDDEDDEVQIVFSTLPERAAIRRPIYIDPEIIRLDSPDDDEIIIEDDVPYNPMEAPMLGYSSDDDFFVPKSCAFDISSDEEDSDNENEDEYNTSDDDEAEAEVVAATGAASDAEKDEDRDTDMEGAVGGQIATTALVLPPAAPPARGFDRTSSDHHLIMQIPIHQPTSSSESGTAPTVRVVDAAASSISGSEIPDGVDPSFLAALPQEMREEVIAEHLR